MISDIADDLLDIGQDLIGIDQEEEPEMDHVEFAGLNLLNFEYFDKRTKNLTGFEGFAPRYTLITRLRNPRNIFLNTSSLFLIIVSLKISKAYIGF